MRAALVLLAACSPDITGGSYLCGANASCPPNEACNGTDNSCVLAGTQDVFACDAHGTSHEPDDTIQQAFAIPQLACAGQPYFEKNCLVATDAANWIKLATPAACSAVAVDVRLTFPIAFEPLAVTLWDGSTMLAAGGACRGSMAPGETGQCLTTTVQTGHDYAVEIAPAGGNDCGGSCAFNRYELTVQLPTP